MDMKNNNTYLLTITPSEPQIIDKNSVHYFQCVRSPRRSSMDIKYSRRKESKADNQEIKFEKKFTSLFQNNLNFDKFCEDPLIKEFLSIKK